MSHRTAGMTEIDLGGETLLVSWEHRFGREATYTNPPEPAKTEVTKVQLVYTFMDGTQSRTMYIDITDLIDDLGAQDAVAEALEESADFPPEEHDPREDEDEPDFADTEGDAFEDEGSVSYGGTQSDEGEGL
jgi:hypothetical protein